MDKNNPAEMSNKDLENEAENNKSTAAEGQLISPEADENSIAKVVNNNNEDDEKDPDNLIHTDTSDETVHNGTMPGPEDTEHREGNDDTDKISG